MYCHHCKHDLRDLRERACPECGKLFDPDDPQTYDRDRPMTPARLIFRILMGYIGLCMFNGGMLFIALTHVFSQKPEGVLSILGPVARVIVRPVIVVQNAVPLEAGDTLFGIVTVSALETLLLFVAYTQWRKFRAKPKKDHQRDHTPTE